MFGMLGDDVVTNSVCPHGLVRAVGTRICFARVSFDVPRHIPLVLVSLAAVRTHRRTGA